MNTKTETKHDEKKPEEERKDLTAPNQTGLAVVDFGDDAGAGTEDMGRDELIIPMLRVLQSNSPQCAEPRDGGLPGARPGMIINTATNELYPGDVGFIVVPVSREHTYPEFTPRNLGGGFLGVHAPDEDVVLALRAKFGKFGKLFTSDKKTPEGLPAEGTELQETYSLYVLLVDEASGLFVRAVIPFASTQIKKYKGLMSRIDGIRYLAPDGTPVKPPLWAHRWRATTVGEQNKKGKFYGWVLRLAAQDEHGTELPIIQSLLKRSDPLYQQAKAFYDLIQEGGARADYARAEGDDEGDPDNDIPM